MESFTVVHVTNYYFPTLGGITTQVSYLKSNLEKKNIKSFITTFPYLFRKIENLIYFNFLKKLFHFLFIVLFILYSQILILLIKLRFRRVVVHSHDAYFCAFIGILSKLYGCKSIHIFRTDFEFRGKLKFRRLQEIIYNKCDMITFVSKYMLEEYSKLFPKVKRKFRVTHSGIDMDNFLQKEKNKTLLYYLDFKGPIILFVGNLFTQKDPMTLVKSIKITKKSIPDLKAIFIGEGELKNNLKQKIKEYNLEDDVYIIGNVPRDKILQYYQLCDLYVTPTLKEALGNSIIESMACGKPVIASNVGGIREIISHNKNGILVEPKKPNEFAKAIIKLLRNDKLRISMGKQARKDVANKFSWEKIIGEYLNNYLEVLQK